jgi:hypothetical protein
MHQDPEQENLTPLISVEFEETLKGFTSQAIGEKEVRGDNTKFIANDFDIKRK